jgi:hypothetical protein
MASETRRVDTVHGEARKRWQQIGRAAARRLRDER